MKSFLVAASALCLVILAMPSGVLAQSDIAIPYLDEAAVAQGATLYAENCASCHGDKFEGEADWQVAGPDGLRPAPPHDETGHTWHHADALLFDLTKRGVAEVIGRGYESAMPPFDGTLTDEEILATLAYIKSTWPRRVIEMHDQMNAAQ